MDPGRRGFLRGLVALVAGGMATKVAAQQMPSMHHHSGQMEAAEPPAPAVAKMPASSFRPVITPDLPKLPWHYEGGAKVFHLVAEPVKRELIPGRAVEAWGFNGTIPGPTIEVREGDRVRIILENRLPEPTAIHWHGIELPNDMDGVADLTQPPVMPGQTFTYEFTLHQHGTHFYHSHMAMQEMFGMLGLFIIHPRASLKPHADKDFGLVLQEFAILPNNTIPNSMSMEFNWLTLNGRSGPATTPMIVKVGERVRIRMVNLGMDHHPMHLHGHQFYVTGTEGGRVPEAAWYQQNTVLVGVGQARDIEFVARYPGEWMFHCHLPHHMMNAMASMVGPLATGGRGMPMGIGMEEGMGMMRQGAALSGEHGPSLGRGMGLAQREQETSNLVGQAGGGGHAHHGEGTPPGATRLVPGFPQDMAMPMDAIVAKPETHGLRPGWSAAVMGMTTLVRVLPPDMYEQVQQLISEARSQ